jgi:hypothetical protein
LNTVGIETTRDGEGGKGNFIAIDQVIKELQEKYKDISIPTLPNNIIDDNNITYGKTSITNADPKTDNTLQLILLGLKTIGDLVVYKYREKGTDVAFVGSIDKGIQYSNVLDCLKSRDNDKNDILSTSLMGVFRSTANGWSYREGVSVSDLKSEIKNIKIKLSSYYHFCESYKKVVQSNQINTQMDEASGTNEVGRIEDFIIPDNEVHRFTNMFNFRYKMFDFFDKYDNNTTDDNNTTEFDYQKIMNQLLKQENESLKKKTTEVYDKSQAIFANFKSNPLNQQLYDEIQKLPDLKTAFLSNVSRFALNNETDNHIFNGQSIWPGTFANIFVNSSESDVRFIYVIPQNTLKPREKGGDVTVITYNLSGLASARESEIKNLDGEANMCHNKKDIKLNAINNKYNDLTALVTTGASQGDRENRLIYIEMIAPLTVDFLMQALTFVESSGNLKNRDLIQNDISRRLDALFMPVAPLDDVSIIKFIKGYVKAEETQAMDVVGGKRRNTTRKRRRRVTRRKGPIIPKKKKNKRHTRKGKR